MERNQGRGGRRGNGRGDEATKALAALECILDTMERKVWSLARKVNRMANTLDDIFNKVTAEETIIDGLDVFISGLKQQLADAMSGATLPPAVQAKVDSIFAQATENSDKLAASLVANVPPVEPTP